MSLPFKIKNIPLAFLLFFILHSYCVQSAEITPEEVKAKYLLYLPKYVKRTTDSAPLNNICYYEKVGIPESESVGQILSKMVKGNTGSSQIKVRWLKDAGNFDGCDILFIPSSEESNIDDIIAKTHSLPILTVSGAKRFIYRGGMIGFVLEDDKVKLEGNIKNMAANDIEADAQLLNIMKNVIRD